MVVDTLENLEKYASLNPLFAQAIEFLKSHDLQAMEVGKTELKGKDLLVNIAQTKPKTKEEAKLETHNEFIDIQIPLSGTEIMGYTAAKDCVPADAPYNEEKDITFFEGLAETYVAVNVCYLFPARRSCSRYHSRWCEESNRKSKSIILIQF